MDIIPAICLDVLIDFLLILCPIFVIINPVIGKITIAIKVNRQEIINRIIVNIRIFIGSTNNLLKLTLKERRITPTSLRIMDEISPDLFLSKKEKESL